MTGTVCTRTCGGCGVTGHGCGVGGPDPRVTREVPYLNQAIRNSPIKDMTSLSKITKTQKAKSITLQVPNTSSQNVATVQSTTTTQPPLQQSMSQLANQFANMTTTITTTTATLTTKTSAQAIENIAKAFEKQLKQGPDEGGGEGKGSGGRWRSIRKTSKCLIFLDLLDKV